MNQMRNLQVSLLLAGGLLAAQQASGALVAAYGSDGRGTGLQTKLNGLVQPAAGDTWNPGVSNGGSPPDYINGTVQNGQSASDTFWNLAPGGGSSATIVLEIAGHASANTFGFYDPSDLSKRAQLFSGAASSGSKVYVKFNGTTLQSSSDNITFANVTGGTFSSTTFGMYLQYNTDVFYSDATKNAGGGDNLVAYQGFGDESTGRKIKIGSTYQPWDVNSYVLGWEDLKLSSSDKDYQDMVLLVSQVVPVPEPSTVIASALLLLPFGASMIRILRRK
jgi:hypothetical protein